MRLHLFSRNRNDDAALIAKDRGKVYDVSPAAKKKKELVSKENGGAGRRWGISATKKNRGRAASKLSDRYETGSLSRQHPREDRDSSGRIPVIDRIPTAIGYRSEGSEDEWLEEKSKCSRYTTPDDEQDEAIMSDDEEGGVDKYSVGKNSQAPPDAAIAGIERLWSEDSCESRGPNRLERMWHQYDEKKRIDSYYNDVDASCLEESKHDPIYETSRNVKEAIVVGVLPPANNPPAEVHERGMHTIPTRIDDEAPVVEEAEYGQREHATDNDQELGVVKSDESELENEPEQEQNLEHEPETAKQATTDLKKQTKGANPLATHANSSRTSSSKSKSQTTRGHKTTRGAASIKIDSEASKQLDAMATDSMDSSSGASDPLATLAKTDVLVKEIETKLKALKATAAKEKRAVKKMQREHKRSLSRGRSAERAKSGGSKRSLSKERKRQEKSRRQQEIKPERTGIAMEKPTIHPAIRKSIFNGFTVMLFRKSDETKQARNEEMEPDKVDDFVGVMSEISEPIQAAVAELTNDHQPEMELKTKSDENDGRIKDNSQLWKLRSRGVLTDDANTTEKRNEIVHQAELQQQVSAALTDPPEHDEYSGGNFTPPLRERPALVQCLKFYGCAGVADNVEDAITAVDRYRDAVIACCGSPTASMNEGAPQTPKPSVEVVLEKIDRSQQTVSPEVQGYRQGSSGSTTLVPEAPVGVKPKQPAEVLNVTNMNLHLDGDSDSDADGDEEDHQVTSASFEDNPSAGNRRGGISVTSIQVPTKKIKRQGEDEEDHDEPHKRSRLPRFLRSLSMKRAALK